MIVGLTGLKGVGKDAAADHLVHKHGFVRLTFAEAVYQQVAINFKVSQDFLRRREVKLNPYRALSLSHSDDQEFARRMVITEMGDANSEVRPLCVDTLFAPRSGTWVMQRWATEYRRHDFGQEYWARIVAGDIKSLPRGTHIVISDLREDHEMLVFNAYRKHNERIVCEMGREAPTVHLGGVLELTRTGTVSTGHSSDKGLRRDYITSSYANDGTIEDLQERVDQFIMEELKCL